MAPDTPEIALTVEVKLQGLDPAQESAELAQMEDFLTGMRCPVGVLISWPSTWVITGPTTPPFEAGYQRTKVSTSALLGLAQPPQTEAEAMAAAFVWVNRLTTAAPFALPKDAQVLPLVRDYLFPAAAGGRVSSF